MKEKYDGHTTVNRAYSANITSVLKEYRVFKPSAKFAKSAAIKSFAQYNKMYHESIHSPEKFWAEMAEELFWFKKWTKVLRWKLPFAEWFVGGK